MHYFSIYYNKNKLSVRGNVVGMPHCLNAPVAMPLLPSRNAPTAKSQCPHILEHCGRNAPLLDGMPHFLGSRVFNIYIFYIILKIIVILLNAFQLHLFRAAIYI